MLLQDRDTVALHWRDQAFTHADLCARVRDAAGLFPELRGGKVGIFSENRPEWVCALYAVWTNECVCVPMDYLASAEDLAYILTDCEPEAVFCSRTTEPVLRQAVELAGLETRILLLDDITPASAPESAPAPGLPRPPAERMALILYTSGTTGAPKGVMLSFDNIHANIDAVCEDVPIFTASQRVLAFLPLHHIFPLVGCVVAPLYVGGTAVMPRSLSPEDIMEAMQRHRVTMIIAVPMFYNRIIKSVREKLNSSPALKALFRLARAVNSQAFSRLLFRSVHKRFGGHVEYMVCGGAAIDPEIWLDYKALGFTMLVGYGTTETAPMITFPRPDNLAPGASGQAMGHNEIKIVDGEIVTRGRNVMLGYYKREAETRAVLKDGWLHTGDLGRFDDKGRLYVTGRGKEIIVLSNGKNINPEEIETAIVTRFPYVHEIGVFAKNDALHALVRLDVAKARELDVLNPAKDFKANVLDVYNESVSPHKRIVRYSVVQQELPRTRLGKLQRFKLRDMHQNLERMKQDLREPDTQEYVLLKDYLAELSRKPVHPGDDLELDLGLDSLDKVSLQTFVQSAFGLELADEVLLKHSAVASLADYLTSHKTALGKENSGWAALFRHCDGDYPLPRSSFLHPLLNTLSGLFLKTSFRLRVSGLSNLPQGPCILAPNHQSFFDGLFVSINLKAETLRRTYFFAKEKHFRHKWRAFMARHNNIIVMDMRDIRATLQRMACVLQRQSNLIIFPEGTRTRTGDLGAFKDAFAILSRELNVPVVPVAIDGAHQAWPRGRRLFRPFKRIDIHYLPPVYPDGHSHESLREAVRESIRRIVSTKAATA